MEWNKATPKDEDIFQIPKSWLFIHYYEALTILFRIENALRIIVYSVLKNEFKEKWSNISVLSDDSNEGTIESIAKKRIKHLAILVIQ